MGSESNPVCEIGPVCGIDPVCETGPASESYKCMAVNIVMLYIYAVRHILHLVPLNLLRVRYPQCYNSHNILTKRKPYINIANLECACC